MDRGPGTLFEPVRDGDSLFRVNLGPSPATAAHVQAMFDAEGIHTRTYRTGDAEGHNPQGSTILLFAADDLATATAVLADVAAEF